MTTPTGTITMLDVILELDGVATPRQITMNDTDVRDLAEVPAGEITMDDLRGKSASTVVVTGKITVGSLTFGTTLGWANYEPTEGAIFDVVGLPPFEPAPVMGWLMDKQNDEVQQLSIQTASDLTAFMTKVRVFGSGKDVTINFDTPVYSGGYSATSINSLGRSAMFAPADVGTTYEFEVFS